MQKKSTLLTTLGFLAFAFSPAIGQTNNHMVIRQEIYVVTDETVKVLPAETFVIENLPENNTGHLQKSSFAKNYNVAKIGGGFRGKNPELSKLKNNPVIATGCCFKIDHAEVSKKIENCISKNIAKAIAKKIYIKNIPLVVTGYTCPLGESTFNDWLSMQRAKNVARVLRNQGYTIADVQGRGSENLVTHNPRQYRLNRRVEITVLQ